MRGCRGLKALLLRGCTQVQRSHIWSACFPCCGGHLGARSILSPGFHPSFISSIHSVRGRSSETHSEPLPRAGEPQPAVLLSKYGPERWCARGPTARRHTYAWPHCAAPLPAATPMRGPTARRTCAQSARCQAAYTQSGWHLAT